MTDDLLQEYLAFMSKVNDQLNADKALDEAWAMVNALLESTEALEGGSYGGLEDMIRSHFDALSECSRPSISFISDADIKNNTGQKGCVVMRVEPDAQEDYDFTLVEEASYPYVQVDGSSYVSIDLIETILDCTRRGYSIDADTIVASGRLEQETSQRKTPRHHEPRKRKAKKRR